MKLAPLTRYAPPRYPTEAILCESPAFLTALPNRWRNNRLALSTLAGVLTLSTQWQAFAQENAVTSGSNPRVAPLFMSDKERYIMGEPLSLPFFLTESEARTIIEVEAKKAGVTFPKDKTAPTLANVEIPIIDRKPDEPRTRKGELTFTNYHPEKQFGYIFVSKEQVQKWQKKSDKDDIDPSWAEFAARWLQESLAARKGNETLAVFYYPSSIFYFPGQKEIPYPKIANHQKLTEAEKAQKVKETRDKNQRILELIAQKDDAELAGKSREELLAMLQKENAEE